MLTTFLAMAALAPQVVTLTPTDDIWVYPHATDPSTDGYLRVWGVEGDSVPKDAGDAESFGLSYLKWSLMGVPGTGKLTGAQLVLTQVASPGYTLAQSKAGPLEARPIGVGFAEKGWMYEKLGSLLPPQGLDAIYGTGSPESLNGETVSITIDLLKGRGGFAEAFAKANTSEDRAIAVALTTALDMSELGRSGIYKLYSKDDRDEKVRPKLVLTLEP